MANTRIDLITGFLGAGKTTLIAQYARCLAGRGISCAVIENEFGAAGVDSELLTRMGLDVREISGGCVCCSQSVNFYAALCDAVRSADRVIVEPSGIYRPDDFVAMLTRDPLLTKHAQPGMLVCVIDPSALPEEGTVAADVLRDELSYAGGVFISHADSAPAEHIAAARERLTAMGIAPERIFCKPIDELTYDDFELMQGCMPLERRYEPNYMLHTASFQSATLRPERVFTREEALARLEQLRDAAYGRVLRVKGVLCGKGCGLTLNMTPSTLRVDEGPECDAYLNVIGEGLDRRAIRDLFR